ncbi:S-adenosyl-L-methionine-dependent methyltransferase [Linderina pennispora]|uniref:S-adenosyl-L-methionine-dependent methyltransferase n=1 Tax=Linderina pennispora TaxID=61395 RepID=A0A1Y1WL70_9FUNG|nr:S-adenosyl-L-methionine-dependent methyltransferase [Linderina pennispora]ORX74320.1 S-adenosyl-L-methionine-dependent methyltransferase [Linderina pennispora]
MSTISHYSSSDTVKCGDPAPLSEKQDYMDAAYTAIADVTGLGLGLYGKRELIKLIGAAPGSRMLDMAAGTGDAAMLFFEYQEKVNNDNKATATLKKRLADTSGHKDGRIEYTQGNAEHMPEIADGSFDVYCCIFGLHNMPNRARPGGKICIGELNGGNGALGKAIFGTLNRYVFDREMANRIKESVLAFPSPSDFANELKDAGFELEGCGYHSLGFIGIKPM